MVFLLCGFLGESSYTNFRFILSIFGKAFKVDRVKISIYVDGDLWKKFRERMLYGGGRGESSA